jgi:MYXO-CTERM domain-containing protein
MANCGDPCSSAKFGGGGYCGQGLTGGTPNLLYTCQNGATASTTVCKCGCTVMPPGTNDVCTTDCAPPPPDMATRGASDGGAAGDAGTTDGGNVNAGCSVGGRGRASPAWLALVLLACVGVRRRRRYCVPASAGARSSSGVQP